MSERGGLAGGTFLITSSFKGEYKTLSLCLISVNRVVHFSSLLFPFSQSGHAFWVLQSLVQYAFWLICICHLLANRLGQRCITNMISCLSGLLTYHIHVQLFNLLIRIRHYRFTHNLDNSLKPVSIFIQVFICHFTVLKNEFNNVTYWSIIHFWVAFGSKAKEHIGAWPKSGLYSNWIVTIFRHVSMHKH